MISIYIQPFNSSSREICTISPLEKGMALGKGREKKLSVFNVLASAILAGSIPFSGCISTNQGTAASGSGTSTGSYTVNPGTTPTTGSGDAFSIMSVAQSNADPLNLIDITSNNGDIGTFCPEQAKEASRTDCECVLSWVENGSPGEDRSAPQRTEANLMRCAYANVPPGVGSFAVRIHVRGGDTDTNSLNFPRPVVSSSFDPANAKNFLQVRRFSCKTVLGQSDSTNTGKYHGILDPQLWYYNLAFNFYSTSLGEDYGASKNGSGGDVPGWECPSVLNDPAELDLRGNKLYDEPFYTALPLDSSVFTDATMRSALETSSKRNLYKTYPNDEDKGLANCPTGKEPTCIRYLANRHDFYLASFYGSIFTVPFCSIHRVSNLGSKDGMKCGFDTKQTGSLVVGKLPAASSDIIGFAAMPDANEACPSPAAMKIPEGMKWAKVWRLRASMPVRQVRAVTNDPQIGELLCTTREQECTSPPSGTSTMNNGHYTSTCWDFAASGETMSGPGIGTQASSRLATNLQGDSKGRGYGNCNNYVEPGDLAAGDDLNQPAGVYDNDPLHGGATLKCGDGSGTYKCCSDNGFVAANRYISNFAFQWKNWAKTDSGTTAVLGGYVGGWACNPALKGSNGAQDILGAGNYSSPGIGLTAFDDPRDPINKGNDVAFHYASPAPNTKDSRGRDVWLLGQGGNKVCIEADTYWNGIVTAGRDNNGCDPDAAGPCDKSRGDLPFHDPIYKTGNKPKLGYEINPYFVETKFIDTESPADFIYVVTPPNVTLDQMKKLGSPTDHINDAGNVFYRYAPVRQIPNEKTHAVSISGAGTYPYPLKTTDNVPPLNADDLNMVMYDPAFGSQSSTNYVERATKFPLCVLQDAKPVSH